MLKCVYAQRLTCLGLQDGRKDVMQDHPHEITSGITAIRSWPGCPEQYKHCDRATEGSLRTKPLSEVPLVALLALEDDTRLVIGGREVRIATNEILIFRGDLCHAGAAYERCHTRLHAYLDPKGWRMSVNLHGCLA